MATSTRTLAKLATDVAISAEARGINAAERAELTAEEKQTRDRGAVWYGDQGRTYWTVTLRYRGRRMTVPFHMGSAFTTPPTAESVLECLLSDASSYDNARSFEDWAGEYGYDEDSRRAERIYKAVQKQTEALKGLLGAEYGAFIEAERD